VKIGIVGLPNAGKSTLFNALTQAGAETAGYPFTTVEPNVAVVPVPDHRIEAIAETLRSSSIVHETIEFHDIAGLVRGAHQGEGLGNRFLANIRETDAVCHVVRAHSDESVVHPEGNPDPLADIETVETELLFADLEVAERRLERVAKEAKSGEREKVAERTWLEQVVEALREGRPVRSVAPPADAPDALRQLAPLTAKPVLYVANVDEGAGVPAAVATRAAATASEAVAISARTESELADFDPGEAASMRAELGISESGLDAVIHGAYRLLELISFFTADTGKEAMARSLRRGLTAWHAAGKVHTDIQRGFVRAEVIAWDALVDAGGFAGARDRGTLRLEGRDYVVGDGDVVHIRHTGG
jgi:GTP-binding protein YchF